MLAVKKWTQSRRAIGGVAAFNAENVKTWPAKYVINYNLSGVHQGSFASKPKRKLKRGQIHITNEGQLKFEKWKMDHRDSERFETASKSSPFTTQWSESNERDIFAQQSDWYRQTIKNEII